MTTTRTRTWHIGDRVIVRPSRNRPLPHLREGGPGEIVGFLGGIDRHGCGVGDVYVVLDDHTEVATSVSPRDPQPAPTI